MCGGGGVILGWETQDEGAQGGMVVRSLGQLWKGRGQGVDKVAGIAQECADMRGHAQTCTVVEEGVGMRR